MDQKLDVRQAIRELGRAARAAARALARADTDEKNRALAAMAKDIRSGGKKILAANSADVAQAGKDGVDAAFIDRLTLTPKLIEQMAQGVEQVAQLADPVGQISERVKRPTCIEVARMRVPRGGKELIERLARESRIPMIKHLDGVCHVYLDDSADPEMAVRIADNAKTQRYGTCNTMETLLVAEGIAAKVLPRIASIYKSKNVEMRADEKTRHLVPEAKAATEKDYYTEWLAPIVSIRVVKGLDEAIEHIAKYGSQHTDAIVTGDAARAERFLREVDSASVMWNASTRFADGYEYGLGAEIGISTDKLHARGPVGLEGLTTQKFVVLGHGEVRS